MSKFDPMAELFTTIMIEAFYTQMLEDLKPQGVEDSPTLRRVFMKFIPHIIKNDVEGMTQALQDILAEILFESLPMSAFLNHGKQGMPDLMSLLGLGSAGMSSGIPAEIQELLGPDTQVNNSLNLSPRPGETKAAFMSRLENVLSEVSHQPGQEMFIAIQPLNGGPLITGKPGDVIPDNLPEDVRDVLLSLGMVEGETLLDDVPEDAYVLKGKNELN